MVELGFVEKIQAIHDLLKTELPVAAGICVVAGMVISGQTPSISMLILGFAVGFFISGTAMMSNDYWDLEVDKINHPSRPLPSGRITVTEVKILSTLFSMAGLSAAAIMGTVPLLFSIIIWIVGLLYNWKYKESGLPGNIMVSISVSSTFILGGIAAGGLQNRIVWLFGLIAFLFDLAEEIASGAMDIEGDALRDVKSIARVMGKEFAIRTSVVIFFLVSLLTFVPYLYSWFGGFYLISVIILNLGVYFFVFKLLNSSTPEEGRGILRSLYIAMLFFVVVFIANIILN